MGIEKLVGIDQIKSDAITKLTDNWVDECCKYCPDSEGCGWLELIQCIKNSLIEQEE